MAEHICVAEDICVLLYDSCVCLVEQGLCAGRNGIALRTLVYHEVMVGYLDYVKRQGFTSMFIWACPPLQVCYFAHTHDLVAPSLSFSSSHVSCACFCLLVSLAGMLPALTHDLAAPMLGT